MLSNLYYSEIYWETIVDKEKEIWY